MFRVVLVDDDLELRTFLGMLFRFSSAFEVVGLARGGVEALAMCHDHRPDAVVTDWAMPDLDGVELARRLREAYPDMVIVLCSAYGRLDVPPELDELGVVYLNKVDAARLPDLLVRLLTTGRPESSSDDIRAGSPSGESGHEPGALDTKMTILQARLRLQRDLGREAYPSEVADATGVSEAVMHRYWDETGAGAVPTWMLERWIAHIDGDSDFDDPPAVVVVRALLHTAQEVSDGYLELIRFMARANAAPEAEITRLTLLWARWTVSLVSALNRRGVAPAAAETAVKRAMIVLWDAVTRWGADGHEGHYGPFLRDALLAQIPEAIFVIDEITTQLSQWQAPDP